MYQRVELACSPRTHDLYIFVLQGEHRQRTVYKRVIRILNEGSEVSHIQSVAGFQLDVLN